VPSANSWWWWLEQDLREWRNRTAKQVAAYKVEVGSLRGCVRALCWSLLSVLSLFTSAQAALQQEDVRLRSALRWRKHGAVRTGRL